jgi:mono/diheme cytochrome c family protein
MMKGMKPSIAISQTGIGSFIRAHSRCLRNHSTQMAANGRKCSQIMRVAGCFGIFSISPSQAAPIDFVRDVRPIFEAHCYDCHSGENRKSGLRLDVKSAGMKGGDNHGPDIKPGNPAESPLIHFLTTDNEDEIMPPKGGPLSGEEIAILTRWVAEGAVWPDGVDAVTLDDPMDHWSFKPLSPTPANASIDFFIDAKLAGFASPPFLNQSADE